VRLTVRLGALNLGLILINISSIFSVYDVTRRETFTDLSDIWAKEIDLYSTNQDCIKMLVGNKVDKVLQSAVTAF
jgi:GTPase SAR1 family protein